jgi:hypothetical protein
MRRVFPLVLLAVALAASAPAQDRLPPDPATTDAVGGSSHLGAWLEEPRLLRQGITQVGPFLGEGASERRTGFYADMGNMITGAGWLSAGPGYRYWFGRHAFVDASAAVSWHTYAMAQARFEMPRLGGHRVSIGTQVVWQDLTQIHYFGVGPDGPQQESDYRLKTTNIVGYAVYHPNAWLSVTGRLGWLDAPTISGSTGWFDPDYPDSRVIFPDDPAMGVRPPSYLHTDVNVIADTRDHPGYPTTGGLYRAAWADYSDRDLDAYSFQRFEVEGAQFLPVLTDRVGIALHGWGVFTDTSPGNAVPFFMLPSLGGDNTLRGDRNYRYHDRHFVVVNAESRFGVFEHMDAAVFVDAGSVGATVGDLDLSKRAYGAGVRFHTRTSTLARIDVAHGKEQGWRLMFKLNDVLRMSRLARLMAPVPFVP